MNDKARKDEKASLSEKAANELKGREVKRFHGAVHHAIEALLARKYEETRKVDEYRRYQRACATVKEGVQALDLVLDRLPPLFERTGERPNWEVYVSGLRGLFRRMPDSYLLRYILPTFGLEPLGEKLTAYSRLWLEGLHSAQVVLRETDTFLGNMTRAQRLADEYEDNNLALQRLYASVKTWESDDELESFMGSVQKFLDSTLEVFILGPVQLYLMLDRDTVTMIFKALSVGRLSDLREKDSQYEELMQLHDYVHQAVEDSTVLDVARSVLKEAAKEYVKRLRQEQRNLRGQLPNKDLRYRFVERFESGALFRQNAD